MATVPEATLQVFEDSRAYLEDLKREADDAAARLETFAIENPTFVDFDTESAFAPQRPNDYGLVIGDMQRATLLLDPNFFDPEKFRSHTYNSAFFDFLEPKLTEFIEDESTGIAPAVQQAIFDQEREQDLQVFNDTVVQAEASVARRGFMLPTDMSQAARMEVIGKYSNVSTDRNQQTTALIAERAQDNVKHSIDAGIRMEDIQSQFTRFFHQMYMEYNNLLINKFRAEIDENIAAQRSEVDKRQLGVSVNSLEQQGDLKYRDQIMEKWRVSESMAIQRTRDLIAQAEEATRIQVEAARAMTDYYRTIVASVAGQVSSITVASDTITEST